MALVAVTAAACSSGSSSTPAGGGGSISPAASAVAGASATASPGPEGHLGAPIDLMDGNGNNLTVTLVKVFDPATVASDQAGAALAANSRWVGVELTVVDRDAAEPGQTLRVDGIGSDGKQINPDATAYGIGSYPECTPTQGFLPAGQPYTMCAGFMVPTGVTVTGIGYTASASSGEGDQVTWTVP